MASAQKTPYMGTTIEETGSAHLCRRSWRACRVRPEQIATSCRL